MNQLEGKARQTIDSYLSLPLGTRPSCPYFNNRRKRSRAQLRVRIGKGTPEEISEEATIDSLSARVDINSLSTDKLKEFLVAQDLGIDCSGFAFHVLNSYTQEKRGRNLKSFVKSNRRGLVGSFLARLRPAENLGVASFANERNSRAIKASEVQPADIIVFMGTGKDGLYNHILVVTGVEQGSGPNGMAGGDIRISYAHSYAWPSDGLYDHGVREGDILVHGDDLLGGTWKEKNEVGASNYTFESAMGAKEVSVRRLKFNPL